jgi:anionic cell wall polymer biosynthesis LytR-Cps2A-Psr (LCP) family protein
MKKKITLAILTIITLVLGFGLSTKAALSYRTRRLEKRTQEAQNQAIQNIIDTHRNSNSTSTDPFGEDKIVRILFIGLDKRIGDQNGHCDMIQLITINNKIGTINITALPRGTYSPLPPGKGITSSDYYVSNACGLAGLDYGIKQIEKILGVKADYLVVIGFSETIGILRNLHLPTTETIQWLRNRHGYIIGEPQRAHNHSAFIKQMLIKYTPTEATQLNKALEYIIYKLVKTDLSFEQTQKIIDAVSAMDIARYPEKITLSMRPLYHFKDISYDPEMIDQNLEETLGPIKHFLSKEDYSNITTTTLQTKILDTIEENKSNAEFVSWAYDNNLWLQIEDQNQSLTTQYRLLISYLEYLEKQKRESVLADYIIEMDNRGKTVWEEKGRQLLLGEVKL